MHSVIWGSSSEEGTLGGTQTQGEETSDREQGLVRATEPREVCTEAREGTAEEEGSREVAASEEVKKFPEGQSSGPAQRLAADAVKALGGTQVRRNAGGGVHRASPGWPAPSPARVLGPPRAFRGPSVRQPWLRPLTQPTHLSLVHTAPVATGAAPCSPSWRRTQSRHCRPSRSG